MAKSYREVDDRAVGDKSIFNAQKILLFAGIENSKGNNKKK